MPTKSTLPLRRTYSDADRWKVYQHWLSVDMVTKKTARECFIQVSTLRTWIKSWDVDPVTREVRHPPQEPTEEEKEALSDPTDTLDDIEQIIGMALSRMKEVVGKTNSLDQLGRVVKDLSERRDRIRGVGPAPQEVNVNHRLADAASAGNALIAMARKSLSDVAQRREQIIDAEPLQLASGSDEEVQT